MPITVMRNKVRFTIFNKCLRIIFSLTGACRLPWGDTLGLFPGGLQYLTHVSCTRI